MSEANNDQDRALTPPQRKPKRHNAKLCPLVIRERIVNALAAGDSHRAIARALRVSPNTVTAVAEQEWQQVAARKTRIAAQSERNATRAAELIAQKLEHDDVPLNVLVPVFGVSVDKSLALRGDASLNLSLDHHHIHEIDRHHIHEFVDRISATSLSSRCWILSRMDEPLRLHTLTRHALPLELQQVSGPETNCRKVKLACAS